MSGTDKFDGYRKLEEEIKQLRDKIYDTEQTLRKMHLSFTAALETKMNADRIKKAELALIELNEKYIDTLEALYREKLKLEKDISKLDSVIQRIVLRYRYIDGLKWHVISAKTGYERTQLYRICKRAEDSLAMLEG